MQQRERITIEWIERTTEPRDCGLLPLPAGERGGVRGLRSRGWFPLTPTLSPAKSDVSDFGHVSKWPNSGKPGFGWGEGVPPCRGQSPHSTSRVRVTNECAVEIELPDELRMLRDMVRRFVDEELIPIEGKSLDGQRLKPEIEARLTARCKELGLWQIDVPKELGGQGLGVLGRSIVWAELGRTVALP